MTNDIDASVRLRRTLGHFATGVTIIATIDPDGRPHGVTISSFGALSLDPPLVQWSIKNTSGSWQHFQQAAFFSVNVLSAEQEGLAQSFCRPGDRFDDVAYRRSERGLPLIDGCIASLECAKETVIPGGDHHLIIGRVVDTSVLCDAPPLVHWRGAFVQQSEGFMQLS